MADERTYIRVHDGIEDHPKTAALTDKGFRLLVTTWGWCSRHRTDGRVPLAVWKKRGSKKVRDELVAAGLAEELAGHVQMHDYLEHQRSAKQIADDISEKKRGGRLGNHRRWHVERGVFDEGCEFCLESGPPKEPPPSDTDRSTDRSSDPYSDGKFGNESNLSNANDVLLRVGISSASDPGLTIQGGVTSANAETGAIGLRSDTDRSSSPDTDTDKGSDRDSRSSLPVSNTRGRGATGPHSAAAYRLVDRVLGRHLTSATRTALAIETATLLAEATEDELAEALERWNARTGIGPRMLPGLVDDLRKEARGATSRPTPTAPGISATDAHFAARLARYTDHDGDGRPPLLALPGGAS